MIRLGVSSHVGQSLTRLGIRVFRRASESARQNVIVGQSLFVSVSYRCDQERLPMGTPRSQPEFVNEGEGPPGMGGPFVTGDQLSFAAFIFRRSVDRRFLMVR
jgi:hypothetical protein